jgi:hypothetical protein
MVFLAGTGPCYDDECSNPGEGWCEGQVATSCEGAGMNQAYWIQELDCAQQNLTCVAGQGAGYYGPDVDQSWCVDLQVCAKEGTYGCADSHSGGPGVLSLCTDISQTRWFEENAVVTVQTPSDVGRILEPVVLLGEWGNPYESFGCVECSSTCGCDLDSVCRDGLCVPVAVTGESDDSLVCCGKQRSGSCPKGVACEKLDGTQSTCATAARCDECTSNGDCESDQLVCVGTGGGLASVCVEPTEKDNSSIDCRDDLKQAWKKDVCGRWVENADQAAVKYACKEDTDQSWSLNACDAWIEMVKDCGSDYRCEDNECILRIPEVEVSPTLLNFGPVPVSSSKVLTLSIGNIGDGVLHVTQIEVQSNTADAFELSAESLDVEPSQIASVDVTFSPTGTSAVQAKIFVRSNDADEPEVTVLVNGSGTP